MTTIKVGDWVRSTNSTHIKKVTWLTADSMSASFNDGSSARVCDCVKVIVRDAKTPRKVKANELWAWFAGSHLALVTIGDTWVVYARSAAGDMTELINAGPTPLKALVAARKALRKAAP